MLKDLRFALRMLRNQRWFSSAVIVTIALGIGINTTVFTLVNAVLFKPVPIPSGERLVTVAHQNLKSPDRHPRVSWPDYLEFKAENNTFEALEAIYRSGAVISDTDHPAERFGMAKVSPGLFTMISTPPIIGRTFGPADGEPGAEMVILLGHKAWQSRYAGSPDVINQAVRLNGDSATIIGVMPEGFRFPNNEDLWTPLGPQESIERRDRQGLELFGLLSPGTSILEANHDLGVIAGRLAAEFPASNEDLGAIVRTFHDTYNDGEIRIIFLTMLGAVGFVLLIACANVANMLLGRAVGRGREIALRAALGATRWQIMRQLLIESILLSVIGGLIGLGLSALGVHAFDLATRDVGKPYWIIFEMNWVALAYFATLSVFSGIIFGFVPALRASRVDLNSAIKDGTPGGGSQRSRLTGALVVLQFALTVVLLAGAGVMMRSFFEAQKVNAFVEPSSLLTARLQLETEEGKRYHEETARHQFFDELRPKISALPGVTDVAFTSALPTQGSSGRGFEIDGRPNPESAEPPRAGLVVSSPNYLSTIGLPILTGRGFNSVDGEVGQEVVIVSRTFAAKFWPGDSPLGQRIRFLNNDDPGPWLNIIGMSADIEQDLNDADARPIVHIPYRQDPRGWMGILVRTTSDPARLGAPLRSAVQSLNQDLPLFEVRTMHEVIADQTWFLNVFGTLFGAFALIGLLMASVGIYGVIAQTTARRTREIGVRMALGATSGNIARLVLTRGITQLALGLILGLGGAFAATRLLDSVGFLIGISPHDPMVFIGITLLLLTIGLLASWLPARRASRISPTEALHTE